MRIWPTKAEVKWKLGIGTGCVVGAAVGWCIAAATYLCAFMWSPPWDHWRWEGPSLIPALLVVLAGLALGSLRPTRGDRASWYRILVAAAVGAFLGSHINNTVVGSRRYHMAQFAEDPLWEFHRVVTSAVAVELLFAILTLTLLGSQKNRRGG